MKVYLSTLMYAGAEFDRALCWIEKFPGRLGLEIFTMFHEPGFEEALRACEVKLKGMVPSFHEAYWEADHSYPAGTKEYARTMKLMDKTIPYMKALGGTYLVFHHNNRDVDEAERQAMRRAARANYEEVKELCGENGIRLVVENAGVGTKALFDEAEFIEECRHLSCPVLIDIGHAFANGWDLERVILALQGQIIAYHIHNNDGVNDCHWRIRAGKLDFDEFLRIYRQYTPDAQLVLEYSDKIAGDERGIEEDIRFLTENV